MTGDDVGRPVVVGDVEHLDGGQSRPVSAAARARSSAWSLPVDGGDDGETEPGGLEAVSRPMPDPAPVTMTRRSLGPRLQAPTAERGDGESGAAGRRRRIRSG